MGCILELECGIDYETLRSTQTEIKVAKRHFTWLHTHQVVQTTIRQFDMQQIPTAVLFCTHTVANGWCWQSMLAMAFLSSREPEYIRPVFLSGVCLSCSDQSGNADAAAASLHT